MLPIESLNSCGNGCGLIAALIGCLGFGSFGAPLKSATVNKVNGGHGPHPFVLQTYKSAMYFVTSWIVLPLGAKFTFTPWGILSGVLWVTGGACGIFGIRNAGLAISVGTWSSITVLVSFSWGIFVFGEKVYSTRQTLLGVFLMIMGFIGMAYFSCTKRSDVLLVEEHVNNVELLSEPLLMLEHTNNNNDTEDARNESETIDDEESSSLQHDNRDVIEALASDKCTNNNDQGCDAARGDQHIVFLGIKCDRKLLGILGAVVDGILGGSNLVPMKIAPSTDRGIDYVLSFSIGAAIATLLGWAMFLIIKSVKKGSLKNGRQALPSLHLREILFPGVLSGVLWSIGNVSQILSVTFLGESIGMSIVQSQMIVSGLLGIVLFQEIKGVQKIACWVLSATLTLVGIVLLSKEHMN